MKVYNWQGLRSECPAAPNGSKQTQEIAAAKSKADLMRLTALSRHYIDTWGSEGASDAAEAIALAEPGVVFWQPVSTPWARRDEYVRDGEEWVS